MEKTKPMKVIAMGGKDDKENEIVAERSQKLIDAALLGLNDTERRITMAIVSTKRTCEILVNDGAIPKELGGMMMDALLDVAKLVPPEKADKAKIVAAGFVIEKGIKKIVKEEHEKHCPGCGGHGASVEPPAAWN